MIRNDWVCPVCGLIMVRPYDSNYMTCILLHTKLHRCLKLMDLPPAYQHWTIRKDYEIDGQHGRWRYIPHEHKTCLEKAPPEGCVVARVAFRGGWAARLFGPKKRSRHESGRSI